MVSVEPAGRYSRWTLTVYGGKRDDRILRLLARLQDIYATQRQALVALSLILWRGKPLADIDRHMDGESKALLAEVIGHEKCPVFLSQRDEEAKLLTSRWVDVLLGEGKDSKKLSDQEERHLLVSARRLARKYDNGRVTAAELRELAGMSGTKSEKNQVAALLKKWESEGTVTFVARGTYKFVPTPSARSTVGTEQLFFGGLGTPGGALGLYEMFNQSEWPLLRGDLAGLVGDGAPTTPPAARAVKLKLGAFARARSGAVQPPRG